MTETKRCGRPTSNGTPCRRRTSGGPCKDHSEAGVEARKLLYLTAFEKHLTVTDAARVAGVSRSTPWRWRRSDPDFAEKLHRLEVVAEDVAYAAVEETLLARCMDDRATAAERIFVLTNLSRRRGDDRWKHRREIELGGKLGIFGSIVRMPEDEVRRLLDLDPEEQEAELRRMFPELGDPKSPRDGHGGRGGSGGPA